MSNKTDFDRDYDFWFYTVGSNCIQFDSQKKQTCEYWSKWQDQPIPSELFEKWKQDSLFGKGMAVIPGKIWRGSNKGKYLVCIDIDNKKGIDEFLSYFNHIKTLEELSQRTIVEQHTDNLERAHIYFIV